MEGGPFTRNSERYLKEGSGNGSISLYGRSVRGNLEGGSFTGGPEVYEEEGSGDRHLFP